MFAKALLLYMQNTTGFILENTLINIRKNCFAFSAGNQRVSVSSLLVSHGLLLVGTNLGVTVALSVPRLQGIPKVTGNRNKGD